MNEFIPFILIVIGWHPDAPGMFVFKRQLHEVYSSLEQCDSAGKTYVEMLKMDEKYGVNYVYHCVPSASRLETDRVLSRLKEESDSDQTAPE